MEFQPPRSFAIAQEVPCPRELTEERIGFGWVLLIDLALWLLLIGAGLLIF